MKNVHETKYWCESHKWCSYHRRFDSHGTCTDRKKSNDKYSRKVRYPCLLTIFKIMDDHRAVQRRAKEASTKAAGIGIMKESKKYNSNNSEAKRIYNQEKRAVTEMNFIYPVQSWATLLLLKRKPFKALIKSIPIYTDGQYPQVKTIKEILTQLISSYCVLYSAC